MRFKLLTTLSFLLVFFLGFLPKIISASHNSTFVLPLKNFSEPLSIRDFSIFDRPTQPLSVPILMYHYIGINPDSKDKYRNILSTTPEAFDQQMAYLSQNGFTTIDLDALSSISNNLLASPAKPVILTFDDGYADFYFNAYPILQKYHLQATEFIPTGFVGKKGYLSWEQIKQMQLSGLVSFEAHTINHVDLRKVPYDQMVNELIISKQDLSSKTGEPVNFIAYPYGGVNNQVLKAVQETGFVGGLGTYPGKTTFPSLDTPRVRVNGGITLSEFATLVR